jgi:hypothetical protein
MTEGPQADAEWVSMVRMKSVVTNSSFGNFVRLNSLAALDVCKASRAGKKDVGLDGNFPDFTNFCNSA